MRKIIHVDMDCFYAAVEMRDNPLIAHLPIAVGGSEERRGVISTCNYLAREYGVRSAMATAQALKLCRKLVLVPGRMSVYKEVSKQINEIYHQYTDLVEPLSLDEAYLDVTDCTQCHGSATLIAKQIRQQIFEKTGLTASAGIAPNKFMAKIASDLNKPNGQYVVTPDEVDKFSRNMSLDQISGVGKVTFNKLQRLGLTTGDDIRKAEFSMLEKYFGKFATVLKQRSIGIDERPVNPHHQRKSVGVETTLPADITGQAACVEVLDKLMPELIRRLSKVNPQQSISKQGIKLKFNDFQSTTAEKASTAIDRQLCIDLLEQALERADGRSIRLIGLSVGLPSEKVESTPSPQMSLFDDR